MKIKSSQEAYSLTHVFDSLFDSFDRDLEKSSYLSHTKNQQVRYREDEDKFQFEISLPGYAKDDILLHLDETSMVLETAVDSKKPQSSFAKQSFRRSIQLPPLCDHSKIGAKLKNGILEVNLPKMVLPKPKQIKIN